MSKAITRRNFLKVSAITLLGAALQACSTSTPVPPTATAKPAAQPTAPAATATTKPAAPAATNTTAPAAPAATATTKPAAAAATATPKPAEPTKPAAATYKEAPMLADLVKAGKLPPIDQRLPTNPSVCPTLEGIGKYGGLLRRGFACVSDANGPRKLVNEGLTWYNKDLSLRANLVEAWQINQDASQWTFRLRKGLKWSDGVECDSDAYKWWYDNQFLNKALTTAVSADWGTGTPVKAMTMEFPDKYTVVVKFANPKPLFAFTVSRSRPMNCGHYMKQFHQDLATDKAAYEKAWKDLKFNDWQAYFNDRNNDVVNPAKPSVGPWLYVTPISQELFTMERNPYFWQVDSAGNQLPYIDKIQHRLFANVDVLNLWILNGEIDYQNRHVVLSNFTLYKNGETKGDFKVVVGVGAAHHAISMNEGAKNAKIAEFFQNRDVRIALNLAVNREEINELVYDGMCTVKQYGPLKASPQYSDKLSKAYIQFDVKKANELLDKAGYSKKGADGFRLWKDGTGPLSIIIESLDLPGSANEQVTEMVVKYLQAVGVKASRKYSERSLYEQHSAANEHEAADWTPDRTLLPIIAPFHLIGTIHQRPWAGAWGLWYSNKTDPNGVEPPKTHFCWKIWEIWDKVAMEADDAKRNALFQGILDIWAEEVPYLGMLGEMPALTIVKNGLKGFLPGTPMDDTNEDEAFLNPQTYYWDDPSKHSG